MGIDLRTSRRTNYERCVYYSNKYSRQEIAEKIAEPSGVFYAKEGDFSQSKDEYQNIMRRNTDRTTLNTTDEVSIKVDDWVLYEDKLWIVDSVSFRKEERSHAISNRSVLFYQIGIRK
jgi:hypothetical protein